MAEDPVAEARARSDGAPQSGPMFPPLTCNTCGRVAVGVCSSGLGAMSFAYCSECAARGAEPEMMFVCTYATCGDDVHDAVRAMVTFRDGAYVTWDAWVAAQPPHAEFAAAYFEGFEEAIREVDERAAREAPPTPGEEDLPF